VALVNSILDTFGKPGGVILHNQGVSVGEQMVEKIRTMYGGPIGRELVIENLRAYFGAVGFGILQATSQEKGYRVTIEQPITFDQLLVGVVRGAVSKIDSREYVVDSLDYTGGKVRFDLVPGAASKSFASAQH